MIKFLKFATPSLLLASLIGCSPETESNAHTVNSENTPAPQEVSAATGIVAEDVETSRKLGQYYALSSQLNELDFTENEIEAMVEGFRLGLKGEGGNAFMEANMPLISAFLQGKHQIRSSRDSEKNKKAAADFLEELKKSKDDLVVLETGLAYRILEQGEGKNARMQDLVTVNYRGTLVDGTVFDEAMDPNQPAVFPLAGVIPGFSEGLQHVAKGGRIMLYIPSDLAYGDNPRPGSPIKAGAMLVFEITVLDIERVGDDEEEEEEEEEAAY